MPEMQFARTGAPSVHAPSTIPNAFTGNNVYIDPILRAEGISIGNVNFSPCARTNWHTHGGGQLLRVLAGSGWLCDKGGKPVKINVGDVIWCPPGTTHWHGADDGSYMVHQAVSLGSVEWGAEVGDEEYGKKGGTET
jgi:quercetin dioxygenase-like cupin family protein